MALTYPVSGPTLIRIATDGGNNAAVDLGYTTNDDMVYVTLTDFADEFTASDTGDEVAGVIDRGRMATITGVLSHFDTANWDYFEKNFLTSGTVGTRNTIGVERFTDATEARFFNLILQPQIAGKDQWTFGRAYVPPGDSLVRGPLGATRDLARFVFRATPVPATGVLYTKATTV